jgi:hypothetical protein
MAASGEKPVSVDTQSGSSSLTTAANWARTDSMRAPTPAPAETSGPPPTRPSAAPTPGPPAKPGPSPPAFVIVVPEAPEAIRTHSQEGVTRDPNPLLLAIWEQESALLR